MRFESPPKNTQTASYLGPVKHQSIHSQRHLQSLRFQKNRQNHRAFTPYEFIASQNQSCLRALPPESSPKHPSAYPQARHVVSNTIGKKTFSIRGHETTKKRRFRFFRSGAPQTISARFTDTQAHPCERRIFALKTTGMRRFVLLRTYAFTHSQQRIAPRLNYALTQSIRMQAERPERRSFKPLRLDSIPSSRTPKHPRCHAFAPTTGVCRTC
jgi:hypothetical protein